MGDNRPKGLGFAGVSGNGTIRPAPVVKQEDTDAVILKRIEQRFRVMNSLARAVVSGRSRALIVSGPPGLGKSHSITQLLSEKPEEDYTFVKGFTRATGLYRTLLEYKDKNKIVCFDDCDAVFFDENGLNLLKAALDTTKDRIISWRAETRMRDDAGDLLPTSFKYEGGIIFITNQDFDVLCNQGSRMSEHFKALMSRAHYINLGMRTPRDFILRIKQVIREGMLHDVLDERQREELITFIENNYHRLREISLRVAVKIANVILADPEHWRELVLETEMRGQR